jgi:hypothetical protein
MSEERRAELWRRIFCVFPLDPPDNITDADLYGIARLLVVEWTETH